MSLEVQVDAKQAKSDQERQPPVLAQIFRQWEASRKFIVSHPNWFSLLLFSLVTVAFTWPLAAHLSDALFDLGDPADSSWRLGSMAYQLLHQPLQLYQSQTLYPVPNVLTLDELLTGNVFLIAPLIWFTNNPVLAFNVLVFGSFALSGFATYLVARHLTGSVGAGLVAGVIFTFSPWHYAQHGHLGIAATEWMIFALYFLMLFLETSTRKRYRYLSLFGFSLLLQALVAGYLAYFAAGIISLYLVYYFLVEAGLLSRFWWLMQRGWFRLRPQAKPVVPKPTWPSFNSLGSQILGLAITGVAALLLMLPFVWPFVETQAHYAFSRSLSEVRRFSASPSGLLLVPEQSWLRFFSWPNGTGGHTGLIKQAGERALYPGLIAVGLAVCGLAFGRKLVIFKSRRWLFAFMALFGLVLCAGPYLNLDEIGNQPTNIALPYLWLYDHVPGFDALRVPYRFGAIFMLGLALVAGYGVAALQHFKVRLWKFKGASLIAILALLLAGGEFYAPNLAMQSVAIATNTPPAYQWLASSASLAQVPPDTILLELPMNVIINTNPLYSLYNLQYQRPLLDGSANIVPEGYARLFNEMKSFPSPRSLDVLEGLKVGCVIVHPTDLSAAQRSALVLEIESGSRLELIQQYPDSLILKVKPNHIIDTLAKLIPSGAQVLLGDESGPLEQRGLYTNALINLLGNQYQYFSTYRTIYNNASVEPPRPKQVYAFAILYKKDNANTSTSASASLGYQNSDLIFSNETIEVYAHH
jgi:hypothetical protein